MAKKKKIVAKKKKKKVAKPAKPAVPPKSDISAKQTVKVATSNLFIFDLPADNTDVMADAILEDIGGQEIINISRTDLLNGQNVTYNVIENLASTQRKFDPNELIKLQQTEKDFFSSFYLDLNDFLPEYGTGKYTFGARNLTDSGEVVYVDVDTGSVAINTVNLKNNLVLEVEFALHDGISSTTI